MAMILLALIFFLFAFQDNVLAQEEKHKKATEIAREGKTREALQIIESMGPINTWEKPVLYDYISILIWDKKYEKAYNIFKSRIKNDENLPTYVIANLANLCRELKKYPEAKKFYKLQLQQDKGNIEPYIGLAWVLNDENKFSEAITLLEGIKHTFPHNVDILRPLAFAYMKIGRHVKALGIYHQILDRVPQDQEAIQGQVQSLVLLGASYQAQSIAQKYPEWFDKDIQRKILNNEAIFDIHTGIAEKQPQSAQHLNQGIQKLVQLIGKDEPTSTHDYLTNKFDLIFALNRQERHAETIKHYENLISTYKQEIPLYVLEAVAGSYLALRNVEKSEELFSDVLTRDPNNKEAVVGKYYTLLESERVHDSLKFIRKEHKRYKKNSNTVFGSPYEQEFYTSFFYGGLLDQSEKYAKEAVREAPFNSGFRKLLGNIYLARGLPRSAQQEFLIGHTNTPEDLGLKISYIHSLMALERNQEAEQELAALKQAYPDEKDVKTLEKDWKIRNSREFNITTEIEKSRGPVGSQPGKSSEIRASLYSGPFAYNFRGFLNGRYFTGVFPEGRLDYFSEAGGINYRSEHIIAALEMRKMQYKGSQNKFGLTTDLNINLNDHWSLAGYMDFNSQETPGRAIINNVFSDYYNISGKYYLNESLYSGISLFRQIFTDHNLWQGGNFYVQGRALEAPKYTLDLRFEAGKRKSRTNNVPYFSPLQDHYLTASTPFVQTIYRNYEFSVKHVITPTLAPYYERGFSRSINYGLRYEQIWEQQDSYSFSYGLHRKRATYDGTVELSTLLFMNLNVRF